MSNPLNSWFHILELSLYTHYSRTWMNTSIVLAPEELFLVFYQYASRSKEIGQYCF